MFDLPDDRIKELSSYYCMLPLQGCLLSIAKACDQSSALERSVYFIWFFRPWNLTGDNYHPNFTVLGKITKLASQLENKVCRTVLHARALP